MAALCSVKTTSWLKYTVKHTLCFKTRASAITQKPHDALRQLKSCQWTVGLRLIIAYEKACDFTGRKKVVKNGIIWYAIYHFSRAVCRKTSLLCTVFEIVSVIFNHLPKLKRSGMNKRTPNNLPCVPLEWLIGFLQTCLAAKWTFHANTKSCLQMMRLPFDRSSTYDSQTDRDCQRYSRAVYRDGIASRGKKKAMFIF